MPATTAEQTPVCTQEPVSQGMTTLAAVQGQSQSDANAAQSQVLAAAPQPVAQGPPTLHHAPTPDQWYQQQQQQQQYQQYYQQYPGYDPYSQQYQHLQPHQQPVVQGYPQSRPYMQLQSQSQSQSQPHTQPASQVQVHSQLQPQNVSHSQVHLPLQSQMVTQSQIQAQPNQQQQQFHSSAQPIPLVQPQTHPPVALPGPPVGPANPQPHVLPQPRPHANPHTQSHPRPPYMHQAPVQQNPHAQFQLPNASVHAVTGHQSYLQPQAHLQAPSVTPHPPPILLHNPPQQQGLPQHPPNQVPEQFPIHQQSQMRPSNPPLQSPIPTPHTQQPSMLPPQGQHSTAPNLPHPGQPVSYQIPMLPMPQQPPQPHQIQGSFGGFPSSQGPPFMMQQTKQSQQSLPPQGPQYPQLQQSFSGSQGLSHPTQRPMLMNQGLQSQPFPQPTVGSVGPSRAQFKQGQFGPSQLHQNQRPGYVQQTSQSQSDAQNTMRPCLDPQSGSDAVVKQETTGNNSQHIDATNSNVSYKEHNEAILKPMDDKGKPPSGLSDKGSLHNHTVDKTSGSTIHTEDMPRRAKNAEDHVAKRIVEGDSQSVGDGQKGSYLAKSSDRYSVLVTKEKEEHTVDKTLLSQSEEIPEPQQDASEFGQFSQVVGTSAHTQALNSVAEKEIPNGPHQGHILGNTDQNAFPTQENSVNFPQLPHQGVGGPRPHGWRGVLPSGQMQAKNIGQPVHVVPISEQQQFPFGHTAHPMHDWTTQRPLAPDHTVPHSIPFAGATHDRFPVPYGHQMQGQAVGHLRPQEPAQPPAVPGVLPGPGFHPLGRGSSNVGHGQGLQGRIPPPYAAGPLFSHGEPLSGPPLGGSHSQIGHPSPANPMDAEIFTQKKPGKFEANLPDPPQAVSAEKVPPGQPGSSQLNMMKVNGASSKGIAGGIQDASLKRGLPEERFKHLPEERYRSFPEEGFRPPLKERFKAFSADSSHHSDRREFEEDLKQFPRPAYFDGENAQKSDSYFLSKSVDRGQHSFDRAPHVFNHDGAAKTDSIPFFSSGMRMHPVDIGERLRFCDDSLGRRVGHPEFTHSVSEFGRHSLRSPSREYPGIAAGRFSSSSGDLGRGGRLRLEEFDGREPQGFGERSKAFSISDSISSLFHESRFPLPVHMCRGDLDGPANVPPFLRNGDLVGPDILPSHLRPGESLPHLRGEHLAPRILPSRLRAGDTLGPNLLHIGEATGFGGFQSHLRFGESIRGGSFASRIRRGESGFGLPTHGYPSGGGFFDRSDPESFDHMRRRKPGSMGWCRICKIDCQTIEGLDLHSQTREHQKMAMDMVLMIKQGNAKKQRLYSEEHISKEDGNNNRKAALDVKK
ncbi:chromatin modification-related protein eaf-1-like [Aristolochia californica]|uniref:chromatin modification-related protein eaf-1-like n=1 Tax=Aristolochia californica TaxID=171875 RepID=UPI0035DFD061